MHAAVTRPVHEILVSLRGHDLRLGVRTIGTALSEAEHKWMDSHRSLLEAGHEAHVREQHTDIKNNGDKH
eukprot:6298345-Amphidinium_carterae.1